MKDRHIDLPLNSDDNLAIVELLSVLVNVDGSLRDLEVWIWRGGNAR